jgi:hypothetical protein
MRRALVVLLLMTGACAGPEQRVEGVVVAVDGGLAGVASFDIVTEAGSRLRFVPDEGVDSFAGGAPLSHLHEHLQTGSPVRITYVDRDGVLVALVVDDAG